MTLRQTMRILFLAAGNSVHSYRWIRFFAERGYEVHWLSLTACEFPPLPNTTIYEFSAGGKWWNIMRAGLRVRSLIREIKPDILHAHYAGSYGLLGAVSGFQPFILTAWGSDILFAGSAPFRGMLVRRSLRLAQLITCDAHHMVRAIQELGASPAKVRLIFFGVETDRFSPGPKKTSILTSWRAIGKQVVISLRNLEPVYDVGTLLDSVPMVIEAAPDTCIVIGGTGSSADALKEQARRLGIDDRVRFIGRYAHAELHEILRSADIYVSTSLSDAGIAASTAEAMACSVPVIVSDTGENDRWIVDGQSGFLVPARNARCLAERIIALLGSAARRAEIGAAGRQVITERNDYVHEMEKMDAIYRDMVTISAQGS